MGSWIWKIVDKLDKNHMTKMLAQIRYFQLSIFSKNYNND